MLSHQMTSEIDETVYTYNISGLLEKLTEIPLDVLFEVLGHLHPMELLNLARTTRALRAILMKRSSRLVWRTTIRNIGLPACPSDLDEPQYVNLAFDDYCHFCSVSGVDDIFWNCRVRCCKRCIESNFVSDYDLCKLIPTSTVSGKSKAIFPFIVYPKPRPYKPGRILYYLPVVEQYKRELGQLAGDHDGKIVRQWSIRKKEEQDRRLTHAALCEHWRSGDHWVHKRSSAVNISIIIILAVALILMHQDFLLENIF